MCERDDRDMLARERERERENNNQRESKFSKCNLVARIKGNLDARMVAFVMHPFKPT